MFGFISEFKEETTSFSNSLNFLPSNACKAF